MKINRKLISEMVRQSLSKMIDGDYYNGYICGQIIAENIYKKNLLHSSKTINEEDSKKYSVQKTKSAIHHISERIDEGKIFEIAGALTALGTAAFDAGLDTAMGGVGQGQGSFGKNLQKYVDDREQNRQNYINYGEIIGYDENNQPIYQNSQQGKFWRGVNAGLSTAAPWIGSGVGTLAGGIAGAGVGSAALGLAGSVAGYEAGNKIGKSHNGSMPIMSKQLRQQMKQDAQNFKRAQKNGQNYISTWMERGINNPYIDTNAYNELNGNIPQTEQNIEPQYPWDNITV